MLCPFCKEEINDGAIRCKHCKSDLLHTGEKTNHQDGIWNNNPAGYVCLEALKSTNTPCLWVSLDYWNLYLLHDKAIAIRCYRGKWGAIGFIIGLFFAFVGFLIVGGLGLLWDKSSGEANCKSMAGRLNDVLGMKGNYTIIEAPWSIILPLFRTGS